MVYKENENMFVSIHNQIIVNTRNSEYPIKCFMPLQTRVFCFKEQQQLLQSVL